MIITGKKVNNIQLFISFGTQQRNKHTYSIHQHQNTIDFSVIKYFLTQNKSRFGYWFFENSINNIWKDINSNYTTKSSILQASS